jgi:hypothetical protein
MPIMRPKVATISMPNLRLVRAGLYSENSGSAELRGDRAESWFIINCLKL